MSEQLANDEKSLRAENQRLTREIERLETEVARMDRVRHDLWAHDVYLKARSKMVGGLVAFAAVLTAIGLGALSSLYGRVDAYIESNGHERIDSYIESQGLESIRTHIENRIPHILADIEERLLPEVITAQVSPHVERLVGEARIEVTQTALNASVGTPTAVDPDSASIEDAVPSREGVAGGYYVVAGSSPVRSDLEGELKRVTDQARARGEPMPESMFPDLRIAPPVGDNRNSALVVGGPLQYGEAQSVRYLALAYGFRQDTFLWPADRAYFEPR